MTGRFCPLRKVVVLDNSVFNILDCIRKKPGEPLPGVSPCWRYSMVVPGGGAGTRGSGVRGDGRSRVPPRGTGPGALSPLCLHCFPTVGPIWPHLDPFWTYLASFGPFLDPFWLSLASFWLSLASFWLSFRQNGPLSRHFFD